MTVDRSAEGRTSLVLDTEAELRCLAHYATSLADTLTLARTRHPSDLDRISSRSLAGARAACANVETLLHTSIRQVDARLAARVREVADLIRDKTTNS